MKTFTQTIKWPSALFAHGIALRGTESHWDSVEAHYQNERQHDVKRAREEAEVNIRRQLEEEHREAALKIQGLIQSFQDAIPNAFKEMEQALAHMACTLTRKLVADVPVDAERMHAVISQALKELEKDAEVSIVIHPEDLELLKEESGQDSAASFNKEGKMKFESDAHLTRGGCYIKTPFGDFDATMESKWERIESLFHKQSEIQGFLKKTPPERKAS